MSGFETTNEERAEWALQAVRRFAEQTGQDGGHSTNVTQEWLLANDGEMAREIVGDLLGNLFHLLQPAVMARCLRSGEFHYLAEHCVGCGGTAEDYGKCDECFPEFVAHD